MKPVLFLILIISITARGQNLEQTYAFAHSLFEQKEYASALETYKRALFFDKEGLYTQSAYIQMADCFYETADFSNAAYYYDLAYQSSSEKEKTRITLQKTSCFLLLRKYSQAQIELFNLPDVLNAENKETALFYSAMLSFAQNDFAAAEIQFKSLDVDTAAIHKLFVKNAAIDRLNPKTAKTLSIILPGLGQLYAGDIKNGINSFLLTGGLLYLGIHSAIQTSIVDATVSVVPWFQRYYMGGFKKAEKIAEATIKERRHAVFKQILEQVEQAN
ncbi:hypothetical protein LAG90_11360 [Marinilongibacter aquaticus]|uniref:tetratricopeptide repeat protein n=1 Tax=Marinilongibacter aquaticus TaxID=2975157 RepID=UPI0021BD9707|nr:hypothetical protein [Marinilongibacter aquaticus]UBM57417.1 hypothetical protein LAG90_11360 [Marinilongibacter aquaticus]